MPDVLATRVLIVEDDAKLAELVREFLHSNGLRAEIEGRGDRAAERILSDPPDLVILDLMLPGLDGLSVCKQVRPRYAGPILMLTARGEEVDEVVGLEIGADDYLAKPVRPRVLLARISSLLRRARETTLPPSDRSTRVELGWLSIDAGSRVARVHGAAVDLTTAEFDLLWLLARHAGQVLTREDIYARLRGIDYDGLDRSIDLRIARLRKKIGDDGKQPQRIKSVRGVGYLLAVEA
jgi:DNA-binding response OmpR family regulator